MLRRKDSTASKSRRFQICLLQGQTRAYFGIFEGPERNMNFVTGITPFERKPPSSSERKNFSVLVRVTLLFKRVVPHCRIQLFEVWYLLTLIILALLLLVKHYSIS